MNNWRFILKEALGFIGFIVILFYLIWMS